MSHSYLIQPDLTKPVSDEDPALYPRSTPFSFPLDPFQQHAVSAIYQGHHVLVCAKTGSGKTLVGEYQIHHSLSKGGRVFYTTPIKSLSNQKFKDLKEQFAEASVGIMTGDIKFRPDAQIVVMTTEILRNLLYKQGTKTAHLGLSASLSLDGLDAVIFDECHYINDPDRGKVWEETMILLPPPVKLVLLSATLNRPELFAGWLGALKKTPVHLIQTSYRIVPLTHTVIDANFTSLLTILTPGTERFQDTTYRAWRASRKALVDDHRAFKDRVYAKKITNTKGGLGDKVTLLSFPHQLNKAVEFLRNSNNLPALFFVFSRKGCEKYAALVERSLLDGPEQASVRHLVDFHLGPYKASLETEPQYHVLRDLMCKGVAFHHSGLLPILKEVVELLFGRGFVKLLFATETFAVGLNMPTKTVVFTSLKKYGDGEGMRLLRTDEYTQMAGRAGRRGKDDKGLVLYLPDREEVEPAELHQIMCGGKQSVQSRMDFHYDFLLKTLQNVNHTWLGMMEQSYWFKQRSLYKDQIAKELEETEARIKALEDSAASVVDGERKGGVAMLALGAEHERLTAVVEMTQQSRARKNAHKELARFEEDHPEVTPAFRALYTTHKELCRATTGQRQDLARLEDHGSIVRPAFAFLRSIDYLTAESVDTPITKLLGGALTLRGVLATEINEGNPILMTELFLSRKAHGLTGPELAAVLSTFLENFDKEITVTVAHVEIPEDAKTTLRFIADMASTLQQKEDSFYRTPMDHRARPSHLHHLLRL